MKYIIVLIISIFFISGCEEKVYKDNGNEHIIELKEDIEVYSDIYLKDVITKKEEDDFVEIISENYKIDTTKLGKKDYEVIYKIDDKKYSHKFTINIVDTESPRVFSGTNKTVTIGYEKDLCDLITYGDNYDGDISCKIEGKYNLDKKGTYKLKYYLTDDSKNTKEVNVTLNVKEKNNSGSSSSTPKKRTEFSDVIKKYKTNKTEIGIDVSKWQGNIDFEEVKKAGATFVMMRIGVQKTAKGELEIDPYYLENIQKAKAAELKVGVYLYSIATSTEEAIKHANWVIKVLDGEKLDLPIVFDWENWSKWNSYKISFYEINNIANNFMITVKNNGYEGMLYSSKFYLESIWTNQLNFPVWLAHYTEKTSYKGKYKMWQLCNNGKIDGINGDVDINVLYN